jgi:prepilin-type N-terminal cleavage/methylation domain-containing protein
MKPLHCRGLTLIELMMAIAIAAILLAVAAPSFQQALNGNRLGSAANELASAINLARAEAVRQNRRAVLCRSTDDSACVRERSSNPAAFPPIWSPPAHRRGTHLRRWHAQTSTTLLVGAERARPQPGLWQPHRSPSPQRWRRLRHAKRFLNPRTPCMKPPMPTRRRLWSRSMARNRSSFRVEVTSRDMIRPTLKW